MDTWIALLRGINVVGNNVLPMKELVDVMQSLKLVNISTYIASGNVVFQVSDVRPDLESEISSAIEERRGFSPRVLVLSVDRLRAAIESNPFPEAELEPKSLHLFFLSSPPTAPDIDSIARVKSDTERFTLTDDVFYLHAPDGFGRSKLAANVERYLGVPATARNWRTVTKVMEMATER